MNIFLFFQDLWKIWKEKRNEAKWSKAHREWMLAKMEEEERWLCVDPVAIEFVKRYKAMMEKDWYKQNHERVDLFRRRMKMDPHQK